MPRFLCLQRKLSTEVTTRRSPADMQQMYAQFSQWQEKFKANLVDMGGRLGAGHVVAEDPFPDEPFVEIKELVGGFMIVSASSLAEASDIARGCPGLVGAGSGVEVIEIQSP